MSWTIVRLDRDGGTIEDVGAFDSLDEARGAFERLCKDAADMCAREGWDFVAYELRPPRGKYISYFSVTMPSKEGRD